MRVNYVTANGIPTRCYVAGESGPPLLLIHGIGSSSDSWMKVIDELGKDFRVVAPDLMGHGLTPLGNYAGGPPQPVMVEHLLAVADAFGFQNFSVLGSSYGALLSVLVHFAAKDRVERVIMLGSASATMPDAERMASFKAARAAAIATMENPSLEYVQKRMAGMVYNPMTIPLELLIVQMTIYARPGLREGFEKIMDGMMDLEATRPWTINDRFSDISCPLLMVWGQNDPHAKLEPAIAAAKTVPDVRFVSIPECGHVPHLEHPAALAGYAHRFLSGEALEEYRLAA